MEIFNDLLPTGKETDSHREQVNNEQTEDLSLTEIIQQNLFTVKAGKLREPAKMEQCKQNNVKVDTQFVLGDKVKRSSFQWS